MSHSTPEASCQSRDSHVHINEILVSNDPGFLLGWWLVIAACSYLLMARWEYRSQWAARRDVVNQMQRATIFEQRLEIHERAARARAAAGTAQPADSPDVGEPDIAELGGTAKPRRNRMQDDRTPPPDLAGFPQDSGSAAPDYVSWFRRGQN